MVAFLEVKYLNMFPVNYLTNNRFQRKRSDFFRLNRVSSHSQD